MSITIKPSKTTNRTVTLLCDCCRTTSVHLVVAAVDYRMALDDDGDFREWGTAQVTKCQGCETIGFRQTYRTNTHPDTEELLFPPRNRHKLAGHLYLCDGIWSLPEIIRKIYVETLSAIQHDMPTLTGMGVRAIIEAVCKHQKVKGGDLFNKIGNLVASGMLTSSGAKILHSIRLLGNEAAHAIKPTTEKQAIAAMKVIDHLLLGAYILPDEAKVLPKFKPAPAKAPKAAAVGASAKAKGAST